MTTDFQVTVDQFGAVNIAPGSLVAFNSGGTEVFTIGNKDVLSSVNALISLGKCQWLISPEIASPPCQGGTYSKILGGAWKNLSYTIDGTNFTWNLSFGSGNLEIIDSGSGGVYLFASAAFSLAIASANYGTSTLDEQEYAYDSTAGTVETWLGVTDPTLAIDIDTSTGIAILYDATDTIAERTGDLATPEIIGQYVPTAYGNTTYGAGLEMVIVDYDASPQTLAADADAETEYNDGNPFDFTVQYGGGSLHAPYRFLISLLPDSTGTPSGEDWPTNSTATIATGLMVPTSSLSWGLVTNPLWTLESLGLTDGTGIVAEQVSGLEDGLGGVMEATTYGETTYNGGNPFRCLVSRAPGVQNPGWYYAAITIDGSNDATAFTGPLFAATVPANTATKIYVPIARIDLSGNVTAYQQGTINWRP